MKWLATAFLLYMGVMMSNASAADAKAIFAGGCFWCMEAEFAGTEGVSNVVSGYTGGHVENPTYEQVSTGATGHVEAVEITYAPQKVSYEKLLDIYWSNIDPFDERGQFADKGSQYVTAIFYASEDERKAAEASKLKVAEKFEGSAIAPQILPAKPFYPAEEYHQDYHKKNPARYKAYKYGSGRVQRLKEVWGEKD